MFVSYSSTVIKTSLAFDPSDVTPLERAPKITGLQVGATVYDRETGKRGKIRAIRKFTEDQKEMHPGESCFLEIKWSPKGVDYNVYPSHIVFEKPRGHLTN